MRISRLDLTRYGKFTDIVLDFPKGEGPDLHIIYGPNEAGKSTLMSAWMDLLFGIDTRSPYNFLHAYNAMQVGARLEDATQAQEFRRIKRRTGTLLDGYGATLPDNALEPWIGSLTRDGYRQMFSLNDQTIEEGGDAILASKGELGEMLFSASAGLAGLSGQLDALRQDYEAFYRESGRVDGLRDLKRQLDALTAEHRSLEVSVSQMRNMQRAREEADRNMVQATLQRDAAARHVAHLEKLEQALPQRARLKDLQDRYAPLAGLYHASDAEVMALQRIDTALETLGKSIEEARADLALREGRIAAERQLADPAVLAQSAAILAAEALRPAHDTACDDLPRRYDERAELAQSLARAMQDIGCAGRDAETVVLPQPRLAELRGLLQRRSGLAQALQSAGEEARQSRLKRDAAAAEIGETGAGEDAVLANLLAGLRQSDPAEARRRAERDLDEAGHALQTALAALSPWQGGAEELSALPVPTTAELSAWQASLAHFAEELSKQDHMVAALEKEIAALEAGAGKAQATAVSFSDAAAARSRREAMWAAHLAQMTAATAAAFEQALREDDQITALMVETMAEAKRAALDQVKLSRLRQDHGAALDVQRHLQAEEAALKAAVAACAAGLGLGPLALPELAQWCDLRRAALEAEGERRKRASEAERARAEVDRAAADLARLMGADGGTFALLLAEAKARVDAAERREAARKHLAELDEELAQREDAAAKAAGAFAAWQAAWDGAISGCVLAETAGDAGAILEGLGTIATTHARLADLQDRIAKMEHNRALFLDAARAVTAALDLPPHTPWEEVTRKRAVAQTAESDLRREEAERDRILARLAEAEESRKTLAAERAALARTAGFEGEEGDLAAHLGQCREAARLRADIATLAADLARLPELDAQDDETALERQLVEARQALQDAEEHKTAMIKAQLQAKQALEEVGGDDALTRIAAQRESLLLALEDQSRDYLRKRLAMMTFEAGLRRFRDAHQSEMLTRASDAFSRLTGGAYQGLVAQPQANREILMAQSAGGATKEATALSKGTRFQLYLALRIAGYHTLAQTRPTVPFIADDIMETFDDRRAAAALSLMAEMAGRGQVIYLTHHRHLCEIAKEVCPGAKVSELAV